MGAYLVDHPPARSQYRHPRRATPTGCVVVHSAESIADLNLPDIGAEGVAKFIQRRTDKPGSYHTISDADSSIQLVDFADEAFGDGTGSNPWAIHISGAYRCDDWRTYPDAYRRAVVDQMARCAVRAALWLEDVHGVALPARAISKAESDAGRAGFIEHANRDPKRRHDPGRAAFEAVITRYAELLRPAPTPPEEEAMQLIYVRRSDQTVVHLASVKTAPRPVALFVDAEQHAALTGDTVTPVPDSRPDSELVRDGADTERRVLVVDDGTLYGL